MIEIIKSNGIFRTNSQYPVCIHMVNNLSKLLVVIKKQMNKIFVKQLNKQQLLEQANNYRNNMPISTPSQPNNEGLKLQDQIRQNEYAQIYERQKKLLTEMKVDQYNIFREQDYNKHDLLFRYFPYDPLFEMNKYKLLQEDKNQLQQQIYYDQKNHDLYEKIAQNQKQMKEIEDAKKYLEIKKQQVDIETLNNTKLNPKNFQQQNQMSLNALEKTQQSKKTLNQSKNQSQISIPPSLWEYTSTDNNPSDINTQTYNRINLENYNKDYAPEIDPQKQQSKFITKNDIIKNLPIKVNLQVQRQIDEELDKLRGDMLNQKELLNQQLTDLKNQIVRTKEEKETVSQHINQIKKEIKKTELQDEIRLREILDTFVFKQKPGQYISNTQKITKDYDEQNQKRFEYPQKPRPYYNLNDPNIQSFQIKHKHEPLNNQTLNLEINKVSDNLFNKNHVELFTGKPQQRYYTNENCVQIEQDLQDKLYIPDDIQNKQNLYMPKPILKSDLNIQNILKRNQDRLNDLQEINYEKDNVKELDIAFLNQVISRDQNDYI